MKLTINELYCFAVTDSDGSEGIPAIHTHIGPMPLVGADLDRIKSFLPAVEQLEKHHKNEVRCYRFTKKIEIDWKKDLK